MKVLMIGPGRNLKGGISSVVDSYYRIGLDNLIDLDYLETYIDGSVIKKMTFAFKSLFKFSKKAKENEIIHIHMSSRGSFYRKSLFILISSKLKKKIIIHIHGSEFERFYYEECNNIAKKYIRYILGKANRIIVLSQEWKQILSNICSTKEIVVIHNSIEVKEEFMKKNYEEKSILFLGRVGKRKGVYDILSVAPTIIHKYPNVKFIIAGDGETEIFKQICYEKQIYNNIEILGWTSGEEKIKLLKEATVYLLPSYNEGMPISILEAMSYKLPIISTNVGGIPQMITSGEEGYLIEAGDLKDLEEKICFLLEDYKQREKMGLASFKKVNEQFNLKININNLCQLYESC